MFKLNFNRHQFAFLSKTRNHKQVNGPVAFGALASQTNNLSPSLNNSFVQLVKYIAEYICPNCQVYLSNARAAKSGRYGGFWRLSNLGLGCYLTSRDLTIGGKEPS